MIGGLRPLFLCLAVGSTRKGERGAVVAVAAAGTVSEAATTTPLTDLIVVCHNGSTRGEIPAPGKLHIPREASRSGGGHTRHPHESRRGLTHTPEIYMDATTRNASQAEIDALFAEIDDALAAYTASIERGLALSQQLIEMADGIENGLADAAAELQEWF